MKNFKAVRSFIVCRLNNEKYIHFDRNLYFYVSVIYLNEYGSFAVSFIFTEQNIIIKEYKDKDFPSDQYFIRFDCTCNYSSYD